MDVDNNTNRLGSRTGNTTLTHVLAQSMGVASSMAALHEIIHAMTVSAEMLYALHRPAELRHVLLVRAKLLLECEQLPETVETLQIILQRVNPGDEEARALLAFIEQHV